MNHWKKKLMPSTEIISQVKDAADQVAVKAEEYSGVVGSAKGYIVEHFGQNGLIATYVLFAVVALLLISKLARVGWSTVKFMAIPAVALAFLATFFLNCSFVVALPIAVTVCSLLLLFKG